MRSGAERLDTLRTLDCVCAPGRIDTFPVWTRDVDGPVVVVLQSRGKERDFVCADGLVAG